VAFGLERVSYGALKSWFGTCYLAWNFRLGLAFAVWLGICKRYGTYCCQFVESSRSIYPIMPWEWVMSDETTDRYITFCNIDCDENAERLMALLEQHLDAKDGDAKWHNYFIKKRQEQQSTGRDNLNFVGHQINALYEYFEECGDQMASDLLYQVEQECC
jgi:hypothetical protein